MQAGRRGLLTGSPLIPGRPCEPCRHKNNIITSILIQQHEHVQWFWGYWSLYSQGPLHFPGNLVVPATLDFHQCQENPKQKTNFLLLQSYLGTYLYSFRMALAVLTRSPFSPFTPPEGSKGKAWPGGPGRPSGPLGPSLPGKPSRPYITHICMNTILVCTINIIL